MSRNPFQKGQRVRLSKYGRECLYHGKPGKQSRKGIVVGGLHYVNVHWDGTKGVQGSVYHPDFIEAIEPDVIADAQGAEKEG